MFYHDKRLQYTVRCEKPNPLFAKALQQAIGGVEGEIRVCLQYLFQGWGFRGPAKYKDMLLNTATEEIGHIGGVKLYCAHRAAPDGDTVAVFGDGRAHLADDIEDPAVALP